MSMKIRSESAILFERTLVYQTVFEKIVVLIQQKKKDLWYTYQHSLIPKLFINAIAALPEKMEHAECSIITSGGHLPPRTIPQMLSTEETLRKKSEVSCTDTTAIVCRYLRLNSPHIKPKKIWVICGVSNHHHPHRTVSHRVFQSVFQQRLLWIQANFCSNPKPSLFEDFQRKKKISYNFANTSQFDVNILSGSNFQTPQPQTNSADFKTANCSETPVVCAAPKKRRQEDSLMDFFDL